jgi:hypothetical protein
MADDAYTVGRPSEQLLPPGGAAGGGVRDLPCTDRLVGEE